MNLIELHDRFFLWLLQEVVYAHEGGSITVCFLALLGLPAHRVSARVIRWLCLLAGSICLVRYNAFQETPRLAWVLVAVAAYLFLRWVLWRLPGRVAGRKLVGWTARWRPRTAWTNWLVRDYFRADPRGIYWLDLARAVRGLPLSRTAVQRRTGAFADDHLPAWRKRCWQVIFPLVEARIQLFCRLPSYWLRPPCLNDASRDRRPRLELDEPEMRGLLEEELQAARRLMLQCWAGHDFEDYLQWDAIKRQEAARQAALWGRKNVQHREALAEYLTFRTPWQAKEGGLFQVAWRVYGIWRHRRQYDFLWFPDRLLAAGLSQQDLAPTRPAQPADAEGSSQEAAGAEPAPGQPDGAAVGAIGDGPWSAEGELEPASAGLEFQTVDTPADAAPQEPDFSTGFMGVDTEESGPAPSGDRDPVESTGKMRTTPVVHESSPGVPGVSAGEYAPEKTLAVHRVPDSDADLFGATSQTEEISAAASAGPESAPAAGEIRTHESVPAGTTAASRVPDSDADLFRAMSRKEEVAEAADVADTDAPSASHLSDRDLARLGDLQWASRLLEAFLGVKSTGEFARDAASLAVFLNQPTRLTAAVMLLMLYALRRDYAGRGVDRQKVDLILQLGDHLEQLPAEGPSHEARQVFRSMLTDWRLERRDYSQLVERLTEYGQLTQYEWQVLADAETALARELASQEELSDMLRYDAIGHYFLAGHSAMWTLEYARTLLHQITTIEEYRELLRANPVEVTSAMSKDVSVVAPSVKTASPGRRPKLPSMKR
ncbi:MAG: hypothetical protein NTY19_05905 [Planctomycetota bacterium]|nr:hypothetical protein [Planctomycetota bacterium]